MFLFNVLFIVDLSLNHSGELRPVLPVVNCSFSSSSSFIENPHGLLQWLKSTEPHEGPKRFFSIKVVSSKSTVEVVVDGKTVGAVYM